MVGRYIVNIYIYGYSRYRSISGIHIWNISLQTGKSSINGYVCEGFPAMFDSQRIEFCMAKHDELCVGLNFELWQWTMDHIHIQDSVPELDSDDATLPPAVRETTNPNQSVKLFRFSDVSFLISQFYSPKITKIKFIKSVAHISSPSNLPSSGLEEFDLAPSGVKDMSQICPTRANDMTHDAWVLGRAKLGPAMSCSHQTGVDVQFPYVVGFGLSQTHNDLPINWMVMVDDFRWSHAKGSSK